MTMPDLTLEFDIPLAGFGPRELFEANGPLFSRWLPDGQSDAVVLDTGDGDVELHIWFERLGFVGDNGFIHFDERRREVPEELMSRQAVLEAGDLRGKLRLRGLFQNEYDAVVNN